MLQGKYVTLSQDGWSNIHREPIIATCLHVDGKTFLHDAVDVGDVTKDAAYCASLAKSSIQSAEEQYGCIVVGFVSDSENKMIRVREILKDWRGYLFISYGCSAHAVNLAQSAAAPPTIVATVNDINKYFRNHQRIQAMLMQEGGHYPQLAGGTR